MTFQPSTSMPETTPIETSQQGVGLRERVKSSLPHIAAWAAIVIAATVLIGWASGAEPLKRIFTNYVAMNPATALAFLLAGISLLFQSKDGRQPWLVSTVPFGIIALGAI